ncbi:baeRF3 domain-containing protein [Parafilimonas sp.]|uniref:baeRF3 domain-containing protein n=1 Tax=Parafilimonas sp. TaxID=1969739 RepID=UPI003F7E0F4A
MLAEKYKAALPLLTAVKCQPCISVIMPFEPKMNSRAAIAYSLKTAVDKIKRDLYNNFSNEIATEILCKLQAVIDHLDYTTHKKSLALYVSPLVEKVYYLDIEVNEKILVNTSFEIREIIRNQKTIHEFLLLVISAENEKIYVGNANNLQLIVKSNAAEVQRDLPERVANFTDTSATKETNQKKFLHTVDNTLSHILKIYSLPLFVMAPKKTMGYFQHIGRQKKISGFIHGNFDNATVPELLKALEPELKNIDTAKKKYLITRLQAAQDDCRLATGIYDVWMQAKRRHKQLLVVEKDFYCTAFVTENGETIFSSDDAQETVIARDAIDNIIETVLGNGGDVEFVDDLKLYNRIALADTGNDW